jgi:hypothetical protein
MQLTTLVLAASAAAVCGFVPSTARVQANGDVLKMVRLELPAKDLCVTGLPGRMRRRQAV